MQIITPDKIEDAAWEGMLEPVGESRAEKLTSATWFGTPAMPLVSLGKPAVWTSRDAAAAY